ncbi:hypothetical protein ACFQ07_14220, partial [Actinomadura adrarensis]
TGDHLSKLMLEDGGTERRARQAAYQKEKAEVDSEWGRRHWLERAFGSKPTVHYPDLENYVENVAFHRDGRHLVALSEFGDLVIWRPRG